MKSVDDRIRDYIRNYPDSYHTNKNGFRKYITLEWEHLEDMMRQYAKTAIQEDRKNVATKAKLHIFSDSTGGIIYGPHPHSINISGNWGGCYAQINQSSIIDAPQIELP